MYIKNATLYFLDLLVLELLFDEYVGCLGIQGKWKMLDHEN